MARSLHGGETVSRIHADLIAHLTLAAEQARRDLVRAEARYGSLSLEYVEAREVHDARRWALREARQQVWTERLGQAWARLVEGVSTVAYR